MRTGYARLAACCGVLSGVFSLALACSAHAEDKPAPTRFDLDCVMTHMAKHPRKVGRRHLRIDLTAKRWCEDQCETSGELKLTDDELQLIAKPKPTGPVVENRTILISRKTASLKDEHRITLDDDLVSVDLFTGECRLRAYTSIDRKLF